MAAQGVLTKSNFFASGKAFALMAALTAFLIPLIKEGIQVPIMLLGITWILSPKGQGKTNRNAILVFSGIFIFHLIAMLYTSDIAEGITDIEHKLSLILFPILFGTIQPLNKAQNRRVINFFCIGVMLATVVALGTSAYTYFLISQDAQAFYTSYFSPFHHPSYIAMYIDLTICIFGIRLYNTEERKWQIAYGVAMFLLSLSLVFPASKMGFINFVLVIVFLLFMAWRKRQLKTKRSLFIVFLFLGFITFLNFNPIASHRVSQAVEATTKKPHVEINQKESSEARKLVWGIAVEESLANPFGVGTGDVGAHLDQAYLDKGFDDLAEMSLNPHNSFLQIAVAQGILAMLWFIYSLIYPFGKIKRNQQWIYGFFLLSIFLNFLVESMLEKQSGVIFFAFFNAFFFFFVVKERSVSQEK